MRPEPWFVSIAVRIYGLLVWLYPQTFRQRHGDSMVQLFRDASRDAYRQSGGIGFVALLGDSIADYVQSIAREHWESSMVYGNGFRRYFSRIMPVCWIALAALSLGIWVASSNDSIGLFGLSRHTSLRFTNGVMEFRHVYAPSIEAPISREQWHETAVRREWLVPPEPTLPGFEFSSGHVLGLGGMGTDGNLLTTITPAEYGLVRVPLWVLLLPLALWSAMVLKRKSPRLAEQGAVEVVF